VQSPHCRGAPYADGKTTGSAIFCAKLVACGGHIAALTKLQPCRQLVVLIGASHDRSFKTAADRPAANRSNNDVGSHRRSGGGTIRADSSTNGRLVVNEPRHQRSHLRVVRDGTPVARTAALAAMLVSATAAATITTAPTYTRRPKNRTDGGVARRRHPSLPQQRLKRRTHPSAAPAICPPRGLRG
jgi:hypothetical protein